MTTIGVLLILQILIFVWVVMLSFEFLHWIRRIRQSILLFHKVARLQSERIDELTVRLESLRARRK